VPFFAAPSSEQPTFTAWEGLNGDVKLDSHTSSADGTPRNPPKALEFNASEVNHGVFLVATTPQEHISFVLHRVSDPALFDPAGTLRGASQTILDARKAIQEVHASKEDVLIVGPAGSGKSTVATAIITARKDGGLGLPRRIADAIFQLPSMPQAAARAALFGDSSAFSNLEPWYIRDVDRWGEDAQLLMVRALASSRAKRPPTIFCSRTEAQGPLFDLPMRRITLPALRERRVDIPFLIPPLLSDSERCVGRSVVLDLLPCGFIAPATMLELVHHSLPENAWTLQRILADAVREWTPDQNLQLVFEEALLGASRSISLNRQHEELPSLS